jgi:Nucleotidyltransferase of unknown function (DUF6036)
MTADVDVTAKLPDEDPAAFVAAMEAAGFDLRVRDVNGFVRRTRVFPFVHRSSQIPVDVVLAGPGLEEEFLARALPADLGGVVVPVISPEDLIVTKLLAARPKDVEDIRTVLAERLESLDLSRIRRLLRILQESLAVRDLKPLFETEIARIRKSRRRGSRRRRSTSAPRRRRGPRGAARSSRRSPSRQE